MNVQTLNPLLGHTKQGSTVRDRGILLDDPLENHDQTET